MSDNPAWGNLAVTVDFCDLTNLIRSLQRLEGNPDCFGTAESTCERSDCAWRQYCLKRDDVKSPPGAADAGWRRS
jgi:hypothetical protein